MGLNEYVSDVNEESAGLRKTRWKYRAAMYQQHYVG
jgi:hypothetical protein